MPSFAPDSADFLDLVVAPGRGWVPDLFRALAFNRELTAAWAGLGNAVREDALEPRRRELVILLVAQLMRSEYEWAHHLQVARTVGITPAEIADLEAWPAEGAWSRADRAVLLVAAAVIAHDEIPDRAMTELRERCGDKVFVEVCATSAYYASVARLVAALGIAAEDGDRRVI